MIWKVDTQPLPPPFSSRTEQRAATMPDTFMAYLQRYHLSIPEAACIAALPALLVWRVSKWLPISEANAWVLVAALDRATGETFRGFILTTRVGTYPKALRFCI